MNCEKIERLKYLFDEAMGVVREEWNFGPFKAQIEAEDAEAQALFTELLNEATK